MEKTCLGCIHWVDATAECAIAMRYGANGMDVPASIQKALDLDAYEANQCDEYEE